MPSSSLLTVQRTVKSLFWKRIETAADLRSELYGAWDAIICDVGLPGFSVEAARVIVGEAGCDLPFIVVTGAVGEERAADFMRIGVHDLVLKHNLNRLAPALARERQQANMRAQARKSLTALRDSEQRFRDFAEASADWVWSSTATPLRRFFRSLYRAQRRLAGFQPRQDHLAGRGVYEPGAAEPWRAIRERLMTRQPFRNLRYSMAAQDGSLRHHRLSGNPVFEPTGQFRGYRGGGSDETAEITARARATAAKSLLTRAVDTISDGFAVRDPEGRLVICNDHMRKFHGGFSDQLALGNIFGEGIVECGRRRPHSILAIAAADRRLLPTRPTNSKVSSKTASTRRQMVAGSRLATTR